MQFWAALESLHEKCVKYLVPYSILVKLYLEFCYDPGHGQKSSLEQVQRRMTNTIQRLQNIFYRNKMKEQKISVQRKEENIITLLRYIQKDFKGQELYNIKSRCRNRMQLCRFHLNMNKIFCKINTTMEQFLVRRLQFIHFIRRFSTF